MHWSRTQQLVALSSAEAELNASVKAACEGLGFANMAREVGADVVVELLGDSSANDGILHRAGAGKVKHLSVRQLWLQERISRKEIDHKKIPRAVNHSDTLTHHWTRMDGLTHASTINCSRPGIQTAAKKQFPICTTTGSRRGSCRERVSQQAAPPEGGSEWKQNAVMHEKRTTGG